MEVNKVVLRKTGNGSVEDVTVINLTQDTAVPNKVEQGVLFHQADGVQTIREMVGVKDNLPDALMNTLSEYIDVQGSITTLRSYAFATCSSLERVSLPNCSYVGSYAFLSAKSLNSVSFPKLTQTGEFAFQFCGNIGDLVFPLCSSINNAVFAGCRISTFEGPIVRQMGRSAFLGCSFLTRVSLPHCVTVGGSAFADCYSLSSISLPFLSGLEPNTASYMFRYCNRLENAYMPYIEQMASYCFYRCSALSYFYAPGCWRGNTERTFGDCINLKSVVMATAAGSSIFQGCTSLESLYLVNGRVTNLGLINNFASTPMSDSSYLGHYGSIYVPSSLVEQYKSATNWITYSDRITSLPSEFDENKYIYATEFRGDSTITSFPSSRKNVEKVLAMAFEQCSALSGDIELPACDTVYYCGFYGCRSVNSFSLPMCSFIADVAFGTCWKLTSVYLPNCSFVGRNAFGNCSSLGTMSLPKCSHILSEAFAGCSKISMFTIGTDLSTVCYLYSSDAFRSTPVANSVYLGYYASIYVPDSLVELYKSDYCWSFYSDRITGISNLPNN